MIEYMTLTALSALCHIAPICGAAATFYVYVEIGNTPLAIVIAALSAVLYLAKDRAEDMRGDAMMKVEYDEHGRSRKKGDYRKLAREEREAIDLQKTADMERVLSSTVLARMTKKGSEDPDADLDALVGLEPVKRKTKEMVARMMFENEEAKRKAKENRKQRKRKKKHSQELSASARHMCFFGGPGTGKTTVARIIAGFLYRYGYIAENKVIEIDGNALKAGDYTSTKTELIVEHALGGVLFIDEAYALMNGSGSAEAIATLIKLMEDHRGKFVLIIAGYPNEMRALIETNPGFSSRIKEYLDFPDYDDDEMVEIFRLMAKEKGFTVGSDAVRPFLDRMDRERELRSFGNARTARNVLDETLDRHAVNFMEKRIPESRRHEICEADVSRELKRVGIRTV